ncbi:MAG: PAS domain S-box protein [Burkholderiaceae bacterium]|nr:PAS domain S-box protein [Burkholderiaceae bacterium]
MTDAFDPPTPLPTRRWPRAMLRAVALALLCAALQALLPRYTLGTATLAPLSIVLGVAVAAAASRGRWTVPAAFVGVLAGALMAGDGRVEASVAAGIVALQSLLAGWLVRHAADAELLQLDTAPRLRRFVLVVAPATALLGVLAGVVLQWGVDTAAALPLARPQLAGAVGRFVADTAGIIVTTPVLLCWLARPQQAWRPRRRLVAAPLVLLVAVMLPGFDEVARRDEGRLQARFSHEGQSRRVQVQKLLGDPVVVVQALRGVLAAADGQPPAGLFDQLSADWMARVPGLRSSGWLEPGLAGADGRSLLLRHAHAPQAGGASPLPGARVDTDGRLHPAPALRQAIDRALAGDAPAVLTSAANGEDGSAATGLLVLQSVPPSAGSKPGSATLPRVVFASVDAGRLLAPALPDPDDANLRVCLTDGSSRGAADRAARLAGPPGCESDRLANALRALPYKVTLGDQRFDLLVSEPPTADNRLFTSVWLLALPAVTGAAMLGALLLDISGRLRRIEDRVRERTTALRAEIDERRQAEARLAVSEQRFRAIFESVNIGVTVVDTAGMIIEANPAFCTMMGCSAAELLQRPLSEISLPDVSEDDGTAAAVGGVAARRQRYLTADGRVLQVAANLRTLHDAQGQPVATVGALQDLTQVLRLREAEREREEAQVASRTKSDFLARLSHELRAPLNAILGFAQMLGSHEATGDIDHPQHRHGLAQIRQAGWHLLDMINDVLDLSRMEAGSLRLTLEPVALADLAQEAATMVEPAAQQARVSLELSLSPQAETVQADPVRLRQVLVNLLGNAIKYNRPGGRAVLRTRPGAVGEVDIEVEDNGLGMSEEQLAQLFTPFNRLGREQMGTPGAPGSQGTGIGLVICRKLADLMHGELTVTSRLGGGSVFTLSLPRPAGEPSRTAVSAPTPLAPQVSIGTALYIEDSEADIATMREIVKSRPGVTLVCAHTAAQGLAVAGDVDLVLLDLDLPDRPGIDVLRVMQADGRLRSTPVIVVSAESRPQRIDECFDAGASQFLTKPLDAQQTLRAIDESLASG